MNYKKLLISTFFILPMFVYAGGGWTKKKGKGYFKVSQWWVLADKHFTSSGGIDPNVTSGLFNTSLYAEYGVSDRFDGIVYFPFFSRALQYSTRSKTTGDLISEGKALNALGDAELGLKYRLTKDGSKFAVSSTVILGIPIGKQKGALQTGDSEFNVKTRVDVSKSFSLGKVPAYVSIYGGFNKRFKGFSDEIRFGGELGAAFAKNKLWCVLKIDGIESLKNGKSSAELSDEVGLFTNNMEYISPTLEVAYYLTEKVGISAAVGGAIRAELVYASASYNVGVFFDLK